MKKGNRWIILLGVMSALVPSFVFGKTLPLNTPNEIAPIFDHINKMNSSLEISSSGKAMATGYIRTMTGETVSIEVSLQQYTNGKWKTLYTWEDEDIYSCMIQRERFVSKGYSYRVETTGNVYDENNRLLESVTVHSPTEYY